MAQFRNRSPLPIPIEQIYGLRPKALLAQFFREHFSFWMICGYLFTEYVRPQSIIPALDILPWAQMFLLFSLIGLLLDPNRRWVRDPANIWMSLFLLTILASSALATYPAVSWAHLMDFLGWYIIYFLIVNIVTSERRLFIMLLIFMMASFKLSFFGARTWAMRGFAFTDWGLMGPPGFFQNSGELAIQMLMFAPVSYEVALFLRSYLPRTLFVALLAMPVTALMTVMGASSRGSQIAVAYQAYRVLLKGKASLKSIVLVAIVAIAGYALLPAEQKARFESIGGDKTSQQRLLYWKRGLQMVEEHPVLGVGFYNFPRYFQDHYPQDMLYTVAQLPHNIFVQVGTDAGLVGLSIFGMILLRNLRAVREIKKAAAQDGKTKSYAVHVANGLGVALWGFVIAGQFVTVTYYPFLWINLAFTVALRDIVRRNEYSSQHADIAS